MPLSRISAAAGRTGRCESSPIPKPPKRLCSGRYGRRRFRLRSFRISSTWSSSIRTGTTEAGPARPWTSTGTSSSSALSAGWTGRKARTCSSKRRRFCKRTGILSAFYWWGMGRNGNTWHHQIHSLGLDQRVVLTGLRENTAEIMRAFDIGVVPSRREAFGIAALEMMRMKVPVIVAPVGGLPELVRDDVTGVVLSQLSPDAIAQADPETARRCRFAGAMPSERLHACLFVRRRQGGGADCRDLRTIDDLQESQAVTQEHRTQDSPAVSAAAYERTHREIFNPVEQPRLRDALRRAIEAVQTGSKPLKALDYGCGSGNLTQALGRSGGPCGRRRRVGRVHGGRRKEVRRDGSGGYAGDRRRRPGRCAGRLASTWSPPTRSCTTCRTTWRSCGRCAACSSPAASSTSTTR